jgi:raffinose/stachyose/melibiose transport system substrate-binding protein
MKFAKFLVVLLVALLALSACGPAATETPVAPPATQPPVPTVQPTAVPPTAEPITLVYWSMWNEDEPQGQVMKQAIAAFEAAYPNVTIDVTWQGRPGRNLFTPAIDSGTVIDLVDQDTGRIALSWGDKYILGLDDYLSQPAIGEEGKTVGETIFPLLTNQYKTSEGKIASVPYNPFLVLWFYNKAQFDAAGITAVPTTFDEWMADNAALKAAGYSSAFTYDPDYYTDIMAGDSAQRYVGCDGFMAALTDKTGAAWSSPGMVQWAKDMEALSAYAAPGTSANLYPAGQQAFALGDVVTTYNGTWLPSEVMETAGPDFQWGTFSWPAVTNGVGTVNDYDLGSQGMAITKISTHPDMAFEFIKYVVSLDIQTAMAATGYPAAHVDVPWTGAVADAYSLLTNAQTGFGWACEGWNTGDFFGNNVLPAFTDLITGKITADAFTARMATEAQANIP